MKKLDADKLWEHIDRVASLAILVLMFGGLLVGIAFWNKDPRLGLLLTLAAVLAAPFVLHRYLRSSE
jgi:hypothetical protein